MSDVLAGVYVIVSPMAGAWWTNGQAVVWLRRVPSIRVLAALVAPVVAIPAGLTVVDLADQRLPLSLVAGLCVIVVAITPLVVPAVDARLRARRFEHRIDTYASDLGAIALGAAAGLPYAQRPGAMLLRAVNDTETGAGRTIGGDAATAEVRDKVHLPADRELDVDDTSLRTVATPNPTLTTSCPDTTRV